MSQLETILTIGGGALCIAVFINLITLKVLNNSHKLKEEAAKDREETLNLRKVMLEERLAAREEGQCAKKAKTNLITY